jgi:hypothetical protein
MTKAKAFSLMKSPPFTFDERNGLLHPIRKFGRKELDAQFYNYLNQVNNAAESKKYYKHVASVVDTVAEERVCRNKKASLPMSDSPIILGQTTTAP